MWDSVRCLGAGFVGVAALLALGRQTVIGQQPAPAANANVYVNPFAATGQFGNAAALPGASGSRLGYGSLTPASTMPVTGYGALAASYANPSLGYGSLTNSYNPTPNNGYGMYGYGMWGTQWMMNPYQGYLSGVADVSRAQAEYYQRIQQAKLTRQEAIRSSIQTRRAMIEEAEWERAHMPDPEKIRQQALERELRIARSTPPLQDVWSARSLNTLLRYLIAQQGLGVKGPDIPLSEETLDHIILTVGDSRGNIGLLQDGGNLHWPLPLLGEAFKEPREQLNALMQTAYKSVQGGSKPDSAVLRDMREHYKKLKSTLDANIDKLTPDEFFQANRYLGSLHDVLTALRSSQVGHYFDGKWKAKARNVAELVKYMREEGLWFAPAPPKSEAAYVSLYYSLAAFDRGMQRLAREGSE